jgi:hypothetical protein
MRLRFGKDAAMTKLQNNFEYMLVDNIHEEMSWWSCFNEDRRPQIRDDPFMPSQFDVLDPIYRAEPSRKSQAMSHACAVAARSSRSVAAGR